MNLRVLFIAATLVAPISTMAQDAKEPEGPWSGKATLGYLATSGNTDNSTLYTGIVVAFAINMWTHVFNAAAVKASESDV